MKGKVYIIGAGPGDPKLLTLKAIEALEDSDIVLYDRLINPKILKYLKPKTKTIYVGKNLGEQQEKQDMILELLKELTDEGFKVARLKSGDPFILGRGAEEVLWLLELGVNVEVIPGVSSCTGVPTGALIPLTMRGYSSSFSVLSGSKCSGEINWESYTDVESLVILMGVKNRECIANELIKAGRNPEESVVFVEKGGWEEEKIIFSSLKEVSLGLVEVSSPAVFIIGKVVEVGKVLRKGVSVRC